jgi:lysozyme
MGDKYTTAQCMEMLEGRLIEFYDGVLKCVRVPMSDARAAAMISFAYNVGTGAFCSSTLVRKLNAGDPYACDELLKWNKAGGIVFPGLTRRRNEERELCRSS